MLIEIWRRAVRVSWWRQPFSDLYQFETGLIGDAVMLVAMVSGAIEFFGFVFDGRTGISSLVRDVLWGVLYGILQWLLLGFVIWLVGTRLFGGEGSWQMMLLTQGFAVLPLLLLALPWFPLRLAGAVWFGISISLCTNWTLDFRRWDGFYSTLIGVSALVILRWVTGVPYVLVSSLF